MLLVDNKHLLMRVNYSSVTVNHKSDCHTSILDRISDALTLDNLISISSMYVTKRINAQLYNKAIRDLLNS